MDHYSDTSCFVVVRLDRPRGRWTHSSSARRSPDSLRIQPDQRAAGSALRPRLPGAASRATVIGPADKEVATVKTLPDYSDHLLYMAPSNPILF